MTDEAMQKLEELKTSGKLSAPSKRAAQAPPKVKEHKKITYIYSKGTVKAQCSCGWQSNLLMQNATNQAALEKTITAHKKTK